MVIVSICPSEKITEGGWANKTPTGARLETSRYRTIRDHSNIELIDELLRRGYSVTVKKEKPDPKMDKYLQKEEEKIKLERVIYADFRS